MPAVPSTLALVWRRVDFRETSRIVTLITREAGKVVVLAKGAHRPESPLLGVLDFLNLIEITLPHRRDGGMRLLSRARLLHERRGLRAPDRYLLASYLAELCGRGFLEERADPELFDLLVGGLNLLERCPQPVLARVVLGVEIRLLRHLGSLPPLQSCNQCDRPLQQGARSPADGGLYCDRHAPRGSRPVSRRVLDYLLRLDRTPGARWPVLDLPPPPAAAVELVRGWLGQALDQVPNWMGSVASRLRTRARSTGTGTASPPR